MADLRQLTMDCIKMLEGSGYYDRAKALPNNNTKVELLNSNDLSVWKSTYYPQLSRAGVIKDGAYFQSPVIDINYGIGADGAFTKYEYVQFLWQAYKYVLTDFSANPGITYIKECIDMLEKYTGSFQNKGTETQKVLGLNAVDLTRWNYEFYPLFSKSGLIPDGQFFGDVNKTPNYGIGQDGAFAGEELCHFLYQLYKFASSVIDRNIPVWKVLFFLCKNVTANSVTSRLTDEDVTDMQNAIKRFSNFIFAFSGGNVAIKIEQKTIERSLPLYDLGGNNYCVSFEEMTQEEFLQDLYNNTYDTFIAYARYNKIQTKWLGLTMPIMGIIGDKKREFCFMDARAIENFPNVDYLKPSIKYPFPEEVAVHEFCHVLQWLFEENLKLGKLVNPDEADKYGYKNQTPNAPIGGFYSFYADILAKKVKDPSTGAFIGVSPEMWRHTVREYNDSINNGAGARSAKSLDLEIKDFRVIIRKVKE
ncbi:MAG: hypothetical protein LBK66_12890 [Spirochaetaceae bacterium]|nr:hypothetical protein [Spirochaetaceae bacterium]